MKNRSVINFLPVYVISRFRVGDWRQSGSAGNLQLIIGPDGLFLIFSKIVPTMARNRNQRELRLRPTTITEADPAEKLRQYS